MSDLNSLIIILLAEACVILLVTLVVVLWLQIKAKTNHRKAVEQLISQIKQQSKTRTEETGSFLKESYQLTDSELTSAVNAIDKQERRFFQKMVDVLTKSETDKITSLDASVAELVGTYKSLKPKPVQAEQIASPDNDENEASIEVLKAENESLSEELTITRETMSNMMQEFGNMFGGGKDHELDSAEIEEKVAMPAISIEQQNNETSEAKSEVKEEAATSAASIEPQNTETSEVESEVKEEATTSAASIEPENTETSEVKTKIEAP